MIVGEFLSNYRKVHESVRPINIMNLWDVKLLLF
jgi:hypothetical protein